MDLKQGNLAAHVARGPLPADFVRHVVRQVLMILERCHRQNRIHGAIRPANLSVDAMGKVRLAEAATGPAFENYASSVSAKYFAPELLKREFGEPGAAVDLYCLGFTALELLLGPAFDRLVAGTGPDAVDGEIAWLRWQSAPDKTLPPTVDIVPGLPADLGRVLERLLKKNVRERFPSAAAALRELPRSTEAGPTSSAARSGTSWLNQYLCRKAVFFPSLALLLLPAVFVLFHEPPLEKIPVSISSDPPRAKLFLNNDPVNAATDAQLELPPGVYALRLELENYETFERDVEVSIDKRIHRVTLRKAPLPKAAVAALKPIVKPAPAPPVVPKPPVKKTFLLKSNPPGADVYINDKLQEKKTDGAYEVEEGPFTLRVFHKGVPPVVVAVADAGKLEGPIQVTFERALRLRTDPPGATLFVDDKQLKDKSPAFLIRKPATYRVKALLPGHVPQELRVDLTPPNLVFDFNLTLPALVPQKFALLVGARQGPKDQPSFVHAESDVETLGRVLRVGGFRADKVSVLTQARGLAHFNPAEYPSAANIRKQLRILAETTTSIDVLVIGLFGHCLELPSGAYFCPAGATDADKRTLLPLDEVVEILKNAPSAHKMLILDCWRKDWQNEDKVAHRRLWDKRPPPGVTILFACARGQSSYEHPRIRHGVFGQFLGQGLLGAAGMPQVTVRELGEYCTREVSALVSQTFRGLEQVPVMSSASQEAWPITAPENATLDYLRGCALLEARDLDGALEAFAHAEKRLADLPELYLKRAEAHFFKKQFAQAMTDCQIALRLDGNYAAAYADLAEVQAAVKDFVEASKNFTKAIDLDPECSLAYNARGVAFLDAKDYEPAIKDFSRAIQLQPRVAFPYGNRAMAQMGRMHWDEAIADFDKALALDQRQAFLFAQRGHVWSMKDDPDRAIDDYSEALKRDGSRPQWWNTRGKLRVQVKDLDNAISDLKKATELDPKFKIAWVNLGNAYYTAKMYQPAADALLRAVAIDPLYVSAHRQLSLVYRKLNDDKKSKLHQRLADKLQLK